MKIRSTSNNCYIFWCPGCNCAHQINNTWAFNGDANNPTISPSILVRNGHYVPGQENKGHCWCTYNEEHPDKPAPFKCGVCHSFVTNGKIQFLSDCTHELAGQTVDLPEFD